MSFASLEIAHDFRGQPVPPAQVASVHLARDGATLCIEVDAPYFADPAPAGPKGPTDRLWEYEVCELFIADAAEHYLEIELSPHGHHLALELAGVRNVVRSRLPIDYSVRIEAQGRYRGSARVPWAYLPSSPTRVNAYLIHGLGEARRYHAHAPARTEVADFHRLESFVPVQFP